MATAKLGSRRLLHVSKSKMAVVGLPPLCRELSRKQMATITLVVTMSLAVV